MTEGFSHPAFERIVTLVSARTGLQVSPNRRSEAEASVRRAMGRAGVREVRRYFELVDSEELPLDDLVTELTVRETYFFREPAHFEFIRRELVPEVTSRRGREHVLRAWTAGCASGEETYSLAIVAEEERLAANLLATDISREALRRARDAVYGRWSLRGLDETLLARWFQRAGERWQLDPRIRRRVSFEFHNLARQAYPSVTAGIWGMDLVLCRNVLIYFDKTGVEHVARGLHDSLAEGGWLITGPSDPSLDGVASLRAVATEAGVFYRRSGGPRPLALAVPVAVDAAEPAPERPPVPSRLPAAPPLLTSTRPLDVDAREMFARGDYERVRGLTRGATDEASVVLYVRATANCCGPDEATAEATKAVERCPLCPELHFLEATLLLSSGRARDAAMALRRVLYLDPSSAVAHFVLGSVLRREGLLGEARKAYRNAHDLARGRPREEQLPLAEGDRAGNLADMAEAELSMLDGHGGSR